LLKQRAAKGAPWLPNALAPDEIAATNALMNSGPGMANRSCPADAAGHGLLNKFQVLAGEIPGGRRGELPAKKSDESKQLPILGYRK